MIITFRVSWSLLAMNRDLQRMMILSSSHPRQFRSDWPAFKGTKKKCRLPEILTGKTKWLSDSSFKLFVMTVKNTFQIPEPDPNTWSWPRPLQSHFNFHTLVSRDFLCLFWFTSLLSCLRWTFLLTFFPGYWASCGCFWQSLTYLFSKETNALFAELSLRVSKQENFHENDERHKVTGLILDAWDMNRFCPHCVQCRRRKEVGCSALDWICNISHEAEFKCEGNFVCKRVQRQIVWSQSYYF